MLKIVAIAAHGVTAPAAGGKIALVNNWSNLPLILVAAPP